MWQSKKYRRWVSWLPCAKCGADCDTVVPHHLKGIGGMSGTGMKAPDWATMPLCHGCHAIVHSETPSMDQLIWIIQTLKRAFDENVLTCTLDS
jgi:hypothetical protein